jgi:hypothetical protein
MDLINWTIILKNDRLCFFEFCFNPRTPARATYSMIMQFAIPQVG